MAITSSINFSMTRNDICRAALERCGALGSTETMEAEDLTVASRELNMLIKHFENYAQHIWKRTEATLFLQVSQSSYTLGYGSSDHATESYDATTLSASAASGATSITVTSATGMAISDYIGIVLDSGSYFWTTIDNIAGSVISLASALTGAATSGNNVFSYTTKIDKPIAIQDGRRYSVSDAIDGWIQKISYEDYQHLPNKTASGTIVQYSYQRNVLNGTLFVWQAPANSSYLFKFTYSKPLADLDSASDNPDMPQELFMCLVDQLAVRLLSHYPNLPPDKEALLRQDAARSLAEALSFDQDFDAVRFKPDSQYLTSTK